MRKNISSRVVVVVFIVVACGLVQAGEGLLGADSVGVYTGFSSSDLNDRSEDYEVVPIAVRLGFDIDPWVADVVGIESGQWWFALEPFYGQTISPNNRIELGCALMVRWVQSVGATSLGIFLEGGAGPMYMTQETAEQGTQFNFINYLGGGLMYEVADSTDLELAVRYRHVSNASLDSRNSGIDGVTGLLGVNRYF